MVNFVATVGDGAISGDTVTHKWMCKLDDAEDLFDEYEHNEEYKSLGGYFNLYSSSIENAEAFATLTMVFQENPADDKHEDGDIEYSCSASTFEKALETKPNYRAIWNHDLWIKNGYTAGDIDPTTATNLYIAPALQEYLKWSDSETPQDGWSIYKTRTKPGVQAYSYPAPVVTVTEYFKKRAKAAAKLRHIGGLSAPVYCFGYHKDDKYWMVNNSSQQRQERLWVVTNEHIYADTGWDEELYS